MSPNSFQDIRDTDRRHAASQKVTWVSILVNVCLTMVQIVGGLLVHAQSLVADGFHSLSDLVSDVLVLFANNESRHPADENHPYGHERIETAAALALGLILAGTGIAILWAASQRLQHLDDLPAIHGAAVGLAIVTLAAKEGLFRYMLKVGKALRSPLLIANAWHARADAASSLVVTVGIIGSLLGWRFLDPLAAIVVGLMIARMGFRFGWDAVRELIDTAIPVDEQEAVRQTIRTTPGVVAVHSLRTRRMAHKVLVDAHVQVSPRISVSEGHRIAEAARLRVIEAHDDILDVLVHIDVVNDGAGIAHPADAAPDRPQALARLSAYLGHPLASEDVTLHYLEHGLEAEVFTSDTMTAAHQTPEATLPPGFSRITLLQRTHALANPAGRTENP